MSKHKYNIEPCPYCGCDAVIEKGRRKFYVVCYECGVKTGYYEAPKDAIKAWNRKIFK